MLYLLVIRANSASQELGFCHIMEKVSMILSQVSFSYVFETRNGDEGYVRKKASLHLGVENPSIARSQRIGW